MTDTYDPVGPLASAALSDSESAAGGTGQHPLADLIKGLPPADLAQDTHAVVSATPIEAATSAVPSGFNLTNKGLFAVDPDSMGSGTLIAGPLKITARTSDEHGNRWGQRIEPAYDPSAASGWGPPPYEYAQRPEQARPVSQ
jgi:hypothetical protein